MIFTECIVYLIEKHTKTERTPVTMKKQLLVFGCAALAAICAACSSDPALESAVITPMEEPSEQVRQRFANELRTLDELEMKQEVLTNCNGELRYCQGVYNADEPGKFAILVFLHGFGERGEENLAQLRLAVPEIVKQMREDKRKVIVLAPECPSDQVWAPLHRGGAMGDLMEEPYQALGMIPVLIEKKIEEFKADKRRVYVTGLSMGGYGALRNGLKYSETFSKIGALSSALHIFEPGEPDLHNYTRVWGDMEAAAKTDKNPGVALSDLLREGRPVPEIYMACGVDDPLLEKNRKYRDLFTRAGVKVKYEETPGGHDWDFWDAQIKKIIDWMVE